MANQHKKGKTMIKKLLCATALVLAATAVQASEANCKAIYSYAGAIMEDIQGGDKPLTKEWHLDAIAQEESSSETVRTFVISMVETAYTFPRFYRAHQRQEAVPAFAEYVYGKCVEHFGG